MTSVEEEKSIELVKYVQRRVFHDGLEEPNTCDPKRILELGSGRCGHASVALAYLLDQAGIENRIVKLLKHVVVEAKWDGGWHLLDADIFKNGVIPKDDEGRIPALRDVQGSYFMDRFQPTLYVHTSEYKLYREKTALVQTLIPSDPHMVAGFVSYYYQMNLGLPLEHPPSKPKELTSSINGRIVALKWRRSEDPDGDLVGYEIMVSNRSRGWNYDDPVYENVPKDTSETAVFSEDTQIEVELDPGRYFWSVRAVDEHRKKEARTYYFPSNEHSFEVA